MIPPDALNWAEIDVATVSGLAHEAIAAAASEFRADLVDLGLPQRARMEEFVAGSTAHRVLRRTTSPVLLVPGTARSSRVRLPEEELKADRERAPWITGRWLRDRLHFLPEYAAVVSVAAEV